MGYLQKSANKPAKKDIYWQCLYKAIYAQKGEREFSKLKLRKAFSRICE